MRLIRFCRDDDQPNFGILDGDAVVPADGSFDSGFGARGGPVPRDEVRLLAPTRPAVVVCVGRNYAEHARELGNERPDEPLIFLKPPASVCGPGDVIQYPALSTRVDHEAELAVVVSRPAHRVSAADAHRHIFGITLANDVTARDLQRRDAQWTRGKGFVTFCPIGPWIDTTVDVTELDIGCEVNGVQRQHGFARDMLFGVPELLEYVTRFTRLEPGDVLLTGTPAGVSPLQVGDTVRVHSTLLGELVNPVGPEDPS